GVLQRPNPMADALRPQLFNRFPDTSCIANFSGMSGSMQPLLFRRFEDVAKGAHRVARLVSADANTDHAAIFVSQRPVQRLPARVGAPLADRVENPSYADALALF